MIGGFGHICLGALLYEHDVMNIPHILAQIPSNASISRIKCPFPIPPNEGLHDISPVTKRIDSTPYTVMIYNIYQLLNSIHRYTVYQFPPKCRSTIRPITVYVHILQLQWALKVPATMDLQCQNRQDFHSFWCCTLLCSVKTCFTTSR